MLSAIKATVKGGIGKLSENPQGKGYGLPLREHAQAIACTLRAR